jgi:predicted amidophosphoribosyltransferase
VAESRKCSQCGKPVSLLATVCPQCGGSSPAKISPLACAALLAAGALLVTLVLWLI